jgi:hypothetical protein
MDYSKITLNGTDWSNLYHCDYCGGGGGELYIDLLSESIKPLHHVSQIKDLTGTVDSFQNILISPFVGGDVRLNIAHPEWFHNHQTPMHLHTINDFRYNLKLMAIAQSMKLKRGEIVDKNLIHYINDNINKLDVNEPLVLRSHLKDCGPSTSGVNRWKELENSNFVEIYAFSKSHLIQSMMMIKKWTMSKDKFHWIDFRLRNAIEKLDLDDRINLHKSLAKSKLKVITYEWQYDYLQLKEWDKVGDTDCFVEERFRGTAAFEGCSKNNNSIDAVDWVYGLSDSPLSITKEIMGVDFDSVRVAEMQRKNVELLRKHGLDLDSTKEDCINYFKAYFKQEKKNV